MVGTMQEPSQETNLRIKIPKKTQGIYTYLGPELVKLIRTMLPSLVFILKYYEQCLYFHPILR